MTVQVKICGINSAAAFDAAAAAGADWIGFVFFPPSPRHVTASQAACLSRRLPGGPDRVGLFVEPADDDIARVLDVIPLHALQLYAEPARIAAIHAKFAIPVWRAVGVAALADLPDAAGVAARLVIEAKPPVAATRPGGNAVVFDWTILAGWQAPADWLLAGGLTPDNVARAVVVSGAAAVDVSSGVESAPGVKDPARIAAFAEQARGALLFEKRHQKTFAS